MERSSKMQTAKERHAASSGEQSGKNNKKLRLHKLPKELLYLVLVCTASVDQCTGPRLTCTCKLFYDLDKDDDYYFELCKVSDFVTHFDDGLFPKERLNVFCTMTEYHRSLLRSWDEHTKTIGETGFKHYGGDFMLKKLPSSVMHIRMWAFESCSALALKELPNGVTHIERWAFSECPALALTAMPPGVTHIGDGAFSKCHSLALRKLPNGVTNIGCFTFFQCTNLALTELPEGPTRIERYAFAHCSSLALAKLPGGVVYIGESAFTSCTNLVLNTLPESLTCIEKQAFAHCNSLQLEELPGSVKFIGYGAFRGCGGLSDVVRAQILAINGSAFDCAP